MNKIKKIFNNIYLFLSTSFLMIIIWILRYFGNPNFEEILFHLRSESGKLNFDFDPVFLRIFFVGAIIIPLIIILLIKKLEHIFQNNPKLKNHRKIQIFNKLILKKASIYFTIAAILLILSNFGIWQYLVANYQSKKNI